MLYQCTTPTHTFVLPINTDEIALVRLTYKQDKTIILQKSKEDCKLVENKLSCTLTQAETLSFNHQKKVKIQLQITTKEGTGLITPAYFKSVGECLAGEPLV